VKKAKTRTAPKIVEGFEGQPTGFEGMTAGERGFWLTDRESWDPALKAVERADQAGDPGPVIEFLRSSERLTPWGRELIADYLIRQKHAATPIYERTIPERKLLLAVEEVRRLVQAEGKSVPDALDEVEKKTGISAEPTLASAYRGSLGALRRAGQPRAYKPRKERRSKPKSKR
jgi:hypothetical protein